VIRLNTGKIFEQEIRNSIDKENIYHYRIPDSAVGFNFSDKTTTRFSVKNEFDDLFWYRRTLFCLEFKTSQITSFSFEKGEDGGSKHIKQHQIDGLCRAGLYKGIIAGFIFNFRNNNNHTYCLRIQDFMDFYNNTTKKSINENDIISYHGININNELKRKYYKYNVQKLFDDIIEKEDCL
jgi:penicillin-binding protein-related factor A (putative recombinase)